ncbi:hypothetical protein LTSEGIV_1668 [Salmonella enterica subsp. enterica serovar Give str. S5-487]|nr:hypothetical protein LTSEGIV_1668 [Salmonella enterica subsp. enterica serovar Give str. S5-487]
MAFKDFLIFIDALFSLPIDKQEMRSHKGLAERSSSAKSIYCA